MLQLLKLSKCSNLSNILNEKYYKHNKIVKPHDQKKQPLSSKLPQPQKSRLNLTSLYFYQKYLFNQFLPFWHVFLSSICFGMYSH